MEFGGMVNLSKQIICRRQRQLLADRHFVRKRRVSQTRVQSTGLVGTALVCQAQQLARVSRETTNVLFSFTIYSKIVGTMLDISALASITKKGSGLIKTSN
jgi:hypothetical protein